MKRYSLKGTPEGFQVDEDENGDFVDAKEVLKILLDLEETNKKLAQDIDLHRERIDALSAGNPHEDKIRSNAHAGLSPLECWGAAAFSALPQETRNRIYVAHAEGVIMHDEQMAERQEQMLKDLQKAAAATADEILKNTPSIEEVVVEELRKDIAKKQDTEVLSEIMDACPNCGIAPCMAHAVKIMDDSEEEAS